jgi:hypothetical protein
MPDILAIVQKLRELEEDYPDNNIWLKECAISKDNLREWTDDLFIYTDEQFDWVLPRLLSIFIQNEDARISLGSCLNQLVRFLDVEKSPDDFPGEEDDWPDGALSKTKKERFYRLNRKQTSAILDWLTVLREFDMEENLAKEVDSAIKYWTRQGRA